MTTDELWQLAAVSVMVAWLAGVVVMVLWISRSEYRPLDIQCETEPRSERITSPGLCCSEYFTPVQRRVIIEWVARDPLAEPPLKSFAKQLQHSPQHEPVPIYWGQVRPLLEFLHDHEMISLSRKIQGRLM